MLETGRRRRNILVQFVTREEFDFLMQRKRKEKNENKRENKQWGDIFVYQLTGGNLENSFDREETMFPPCCLMQFDSIIARPGGINRIRK